MSAPDPFLEFLKNELLQKFSSIDNSIGTMRLLKKNDFEKMSRIIDINLDKNSFFKELQKTNFKTQKPLGTSISVSTLERLFKYGYILHPVDQRIRNTLNKLACFLDYNNWDEFSERKKLELKLEDQNLEHLLENIIHNACKAEFDAYKRVPEVYTQDLEKYFIIEGSAYKRIRLILERHSDKKWILNNVSNPSAYEMYQIKLIRVNNKEAIIEAEEYWYLRWFNLNESKYCYIYNEKYLQTYKLVNVHGTWKINSGFYPSPTNKQILRE